MSKNNKKNTNNKNIDNEIINQDNAKVEHSDKPVKANSKKKLSKDSIGFYIVLGIISGAVIIFLIIAVIMVIKGVEEKKREGETIDLLSANFDKPITYTDEREFQLGYYSFYTDKEGNKIDPPEGLTIEGDYSLYGIGEVSVNSIESDPYMDVTINYSLIVKSNFTYHTPYDFPEDIGWSGYYNEFFVFDTNTGKILNTDDISLGDNKKEYQYNLVTENGIYTVGVSTSKVTYDDSYSNWEETEEGLFEFCADDDYYISLSIHYPRNYDGLAIALKKDITEEDDNLSRTVKDMYFLQSDGDTTDNYYVIKLSDLINEQTN